VTRAAEITAESIREAVAAIVPGRTEADVAATILAGFATGGAMRAAFSCIIASGLNALQFHYSANQRTLTGDELILIDVGAEFGRYAGDVSRTFPVNGAFTGRQRALYELVLGAADTAIASVRPGVSLNALESLTRAWMGAHSGSLCGDENCVNYFAHDLSHWLGLNVHDVGGDRNTPLQPGMVITIEPGIYLREESLGIRIEDDVLVTEAGHRVLSDAVPRTVAEIEALFATRAAVSSATRPTRKPLD
jgi:Xaa-Pro aminopeptidase